MAFGDAEFVARFKKYYRESLGCWLWHGTIDNYGYGAFCVSINGRRGNPHAHRVAYQLFVGPIAPGMLVCHTCDVRNCVNPSHLFLGTAGDNARDMARKGRATRRPGEAHPMAKLTEADVIAIRSASGDGVAHTIIAATYGVDPSCISHIVSRRRWPHT